MANKITESEISTLVDAFYVKVRKDSDIGPIFNSIIDDWPYHLAILKDFWSTVLLTTGRYKGDPMMKYLQLSLDPQHFERWLTLFEETANETLSLDHAAIIIQKSHRIAQNFKAGISHHRDRPTPSGA